MNITRTDGRLDADVDTTDQDTKRALARPDFFTYFGDDRNKMFVSWSPGPGIQHRDSDLVDQSNAVVLVKLLNSDQSLIGDWHLTSCCSHWVVGWVEHLSFRAIDDDGTPTRVLRVMREWFRPLREDYPIADQYDLSEREHADKITNIQVEGRRLLGTGAPTDWAYSAWSWFIDYHERAVEPRGGRGGCPTAAQVQVALEALGLLRDEREEIQA